MQFLSINPLIWIKNVGNFIYCYYCSSPYITVIFPTTFTDSINFLFTRSPSTSKHQSNKYLLLLLRWLSLFGPTHTFRNCLPQPQDVVVLLIVRSKRLSLSVCPVSYFIFFLHWVTIAQGIPFMELSCNRRNHCVGYVECLIAVFLFCLEMPLHEEEKNCIWLWRNKTVGDCLFA